MSTTSVLVVRRPANALLARMADFAELTKPRIVLLELIVASAAACLAAPHHLELVTLLYALAGTGLVAASASAANQWIERFSDATMPRTANRPLPTGRLTGNEVLLFSATCLLFGTCLLVWKVNVLTAVLGVSSWILYVPIYTPLKRRSTFNTVVGAVAGAIPILMGWTSTGAPLNLTAWSLATVLFLWQFPHFMAIAWLYRRDYSAAGLQMLTVVDPTGIRAGALAISCAAMLVPVSLIPAVMPTGGSPLLYLTWTFALGAIQTGVAVCFAIFRDVYSARLLLRVSILFLPAWLVMLLIVTL